MNEVAVVTTGVVVGEKLFGQTQCLGDLSGNKTMVCVAHRLVMHPLVEVALIREESHEVFVAPSWPVVRCENNVSLVAEHFHCLIDVLRPIHCVAHECTTNRNEVVHCVAAVLRHAQCVEIGEEEVHLRWCFCFRRELEDDANSVNNHLFASGSDVMCRRNETWRPNRDRVAQATVNMTGRTGGKQWSELIDGTSTHRWTSDHVLADGLAHEVLWRDDDATTSIHFFLRCDSENSTEVIGV